jgi:Arc/MetJ-type ribon-helix-helix transcriptional regulator
MATQTLAHGVAVIAVAQRLGHAEPPPLSMSTGTASPALTWTPPEILAAGMVNGMATRKVTVTLEEAQLDQIRKLVDAGSASSVSGFVQHAVSVAIDDVAGWGALLAEALRDSGGPLTDEERAWADGLLGTPRRRRGSAA